MSTLEDIYASTKGSPLGWYDASTGKYHSRNQQASNPAPAQNVAAPAQTTVTNQQETTTEQKPMSYADLFVAMNPYKPMTAAEKEAERKRNQRNAVFAAIGDGISALSNLYFTTKGAPNAYTGGSTLTGKLYERQEQLRKERQAMDQNYVQNYLRALQMDRQNEQSERNWRMQLDKLAFDRDWKQKEWERNEQRYQNQQEDDKAKRDWEKEKFDRQQRSINGRAAASLAETKRYHDAQIANTKSKNADTMRGKPIRFTDSKGNDISVYENVWKGSMDQVLDAILQNEYNQALQKGSYSKDFADYKSMKLSSSKLGTKAKIEEYVKNHWNEYPESRQMMKILSQVDPAAMMSNIQDDTNWDDYATGGEETINWDDYYTEE